MKIEWVRKVDSDGMHNAFTALNYFNGKYFLAYRKAKGHVSDQAFQVVMTSENGEEWKLERKKYIEDDRGVALDYRDSSFLKLENKLLLYSFATAAKNGVRGKSLSFLQTITAETNELPEPVAIQKDAVLWKPMNSGENFYAAGYLRTESEGLQVYLYHSRDGMKWERGRHIAAGGETCLYAPDDKRLIAFVRTEKPPYHLEIFASLKPFEKWQKINEIPEIIQCPHMIEINGKAYIAGRERPDYMATADKDNPSFSRHRTKIWEFENNSLKEILELPSAGDNSYPGTAIMPDGSLLMSYYSQHETAAVGTWKSEMPADIFVAKIHL